METNELILKLVDKIEAAHLRTNYLTLQPGESVEAIPPPSVSEPERRKVDPELLRKLKACEAWQTTVCKDCVEWAAVCAEKYADNFMLSDFRALIAYLEGEP